MFSQKCNFTSTLPQGWETSCKEKRRWDNYENQKACRARIKQCLQGIADSGTDELIESNLYKWSQSTFYHGGRWILEPQSITKEQLFLSVILTVGCVWIGRVSFFESVVSGRQTTIGGSFIPISIWAVHFWKENEDWKCWGSWEMVVDLIRNR